MLFPVRPSVFGIAMLLLLTACGGGGGSDDDEPSTDSPTDGNTDDDVVGSTNQVCKHDNIVATAPRESFILNGDGTVTDKRTGLQWKRCLEGQVILNGACDGTAILHTWQ